MSHTVDAADIKSVAKHGTAKDGDLRVAEHGLYVGVLGMVYVEMVVVLSYKNLIARSMYNWNLARERARC